MRARSPPRLGLPGIPAEAETIIVERDLRLVALTGGRYHAASISCAASLDVIREARQAGLKVTCSVTHQPSDAERERCRLLPHLFQDHPAAAAGKRPARHGGRRAARRYRRDRLRRTIPRMPTSSAAPSRKPPMARWAWKRCFPAALQLYHNGGIALQPLLAAMSARARASSRPAGRTAGRRVLLPICA